MSKRGAYFTLGIVAVIFALGVLDVTFADPATADLPENLIALAGVVLSGVAVGVLVSALRRNGNGSNGRRGE